ncbi:MAG: flavodoxin domain-containing protein [Anaerolineae bacterium]|nr:flavodoxin domain-containing protein [Anaerolineae bacterium]
MKSLIIYESFYGHTQVVAQAIAETLALHGDVNLIHVTAAQINDLRDIDLLVVGCPTQALGITAATRAFLNQIPEEGLYGIRVALFDTRYQRMMWLPGSSAERLERTITRLGGGVVAPPESFVVADREGPLVEGEVERARSWATALVAAKVIEPA